MKKTRILCAVALLATVIAMSACGDSSTAAPSETQAPKTENTEAVTEAETTDPMLEKFEAIDLGGADYTIYAYQSDFYPNYAGEDANGDNINDAQYQRDQWVMNNLNVSIKYGTCNDAGTMVTEMKKIVQAGDTTYDCIEGILADSIANLVQSGMLIDLNSVEGMDLTAPWWSSNTSNAFTISGKTYITTGPLSLSYYYAPRLVAFNQRLMESYDLGDIYQVVTDGKWTLDTMSGMMKTVTQDLNGDGVMGEDDLWGASVDEYSAAGFYISAGGTQTATGSDGVPYFTLAEDRNVNIIEKVASVIGNADLTQKAEKLASRSGEYDIRDKVYTFKNGNALFLGYGAQAIAFYLRDMADDYGILPVPKYDEAQTNYITFASAYSPCYIGLPKTNQRGSLNADVLNAMGYISKRDLEPIISEVLLKGKAARDEESMKMIDLIYEDIVLDMNACFNFGGSFTLIRDITMGNKTGFVSSWTKIASKSEKAMLKTFEKFAEEE